MGIEALGYIGVRAKDLGDWASYGDNFLGLQRIDKSRSTPGVPHGRPQAAAGGRCRRRAGHRLLRLGGGGRRRARRACRAARRRRHQGRARLARARRRAAGQGPDRAQRSRRQPAGDSSTAPRPPTDPFKPGRNISGLPHRPARHGPRGDAFRAHRRGDDVLSGGARVQAQRLLAAPVPGLFLPRQSAPSQHRASSRAARTWSIT